MYSYKYPHPAITVDLAVFRTLPEGRSPCPDVLLIRRRSDPFAGFWALPGGYMDISERAEDAARREVLEETGLTVEEIRFVGYFDAVDRDPRERTIALAFLAEIHDAPASLSPADDADDAKWYQLDELPPLAFDHAEVIKAAVRVWESTR